MKEVFNVLFDARWVKQYIRKLCQHFHPEIHDMWFTNETKFNTFCLFCFQRASGKLKTISCESVCDVNKKLSVVLMDEFLAYMHEYTRTIVNAHDSLVDKPAEGTCPICQDEGCDCLITCCNGGIHRDCYVDYRSNEYVHCPLCRN